MKPSPRNLDRLVEEQVQRWMMHQRARAAAHPAPVIARPIVTISREAGAHGTEVGRHVASRLGFSFWDQELVHRIAEQSGAADLSYVDEREVNAVEGLIADILMGDPVNREGYAERLLALIVAISRRGNAVVVGRGAQFVVPGEDALRVRVVGDLEARVHNMMADARLPEREARHRLERIDRERSAFIRHRYGKDAAQPGAYDLLVNATSLSVEQAAQVIVGAYQAKFAARA